MRDRMSIDKFLEKQQTTRIGSSGDRESAICRLETSKLIAANFETFDELRVHLQHPDRPISLTGVTRDSPVLQRFADLGWIECSDKLGKRVNFPPSIGLDIKAYIFGRWLEEYVFCAFESAGSDETYYSQRVEWTFDSIKGKNEIDVIAMRGGAVGFASCKAIQSTPHKGVESDMTTYLREVHDWDSHFSGGYARAMLVTTLDLFSGDEVRRELARYPVINAKSKALKMTLLGLEQLRWESLVSECDRLLR